MFVCLFVCRRCCFFFAFYQLLHISCDNSKHKLAKEVTSWQPASDRLRVVSNFGDGDCGVGEIHRRAREISRRRDANRTPKMRSRAGKGFSALIRI